MEDLNLVDSKVQPLVPKHSQRLRRLNRLGDSEMVVDVGVSKNKGGPPKWMDGENHGTPY